MTSPMKLRTPGDGTPAKVAPRPNFNAAKSAKHAADEGETLVEAGQENMQPDYELDSSTPEEAGHGEDHPQRPTYARANPWPATDVPKLGEAVKHKPFKF